MTPGWALLTGLGLGLRHATDADHLVAIGTLLRSEPGRWRAARVAALWGVGHTATLEGVGLVVILAGVRLPLSFERAAELLVAAMLVSLGLAQLVGARRPAVSRPPRWRPLAVGLVHGLAGSAAVALLAVSSIESVPLALAWLLLFGAGTVLGMVIVTVFLSWPLARLLDRERAGRAVLVAVGLASVVLGLGTAAEALDLT
jgi:nickel/cobalt transporter (NicO) family protein